MERPNHSHLIVFLFCLLVFMNSPGMARDGDTGHTSFQNLIYKAYIESRMSLWESTLAAMETEYRQHPGELLLYDILLAKYGLTGYYLGVNDNSAAREVLNSAQNYLAILESAGGWEAEAATFRAAFNGFRIGLRPWLGVRLGPQSQSLVNAAISQKPDYPHAWIEKGNIMYYAPAIFGGSKTKAIEYYQQALALMGEHLQNNHRWLYLSTLVSLATAYEETGQTDLAIQMLEKALEAEPGFVWVKDELLPELKAK